MELLNDRFWPCSQYIGRTGVPIWAYNRVEWDQFWPKSSHDFFTTKKDYIKYKLSGWVLEAWQVRENTRDSLLPSTATRRPDRLLPIFTHDFYRWTMTSDSAIFLPCWDSSREKISQMFSTEDFLHSIVPARGKAVFHKPRLCIL